MAGLVGLERTVATSGANAIGTASAGGGAGASNDAAPREVRMVTVAYSAAPTQAGVTLTLNSGAGAGYDTTLFTGTANTRYNAWFFAPGELVLGPDDTLDISAPAGGGVITSAITILTEGHYGT